MRIQWIGGPTFLLELGSFRILADPVLGEGEVKISQPDGESLAVGRQAPLPSFDLKSVGMAVICCDREDHFDAAAAERLDKALPCVVPPGVTGRLTRVGFQNVRALGWGQSLKETRGDESLMIDAVPTTQPDRNGYVFTHSEGDRHATVYWTGATGWFNEARNIKTRLRTLDVLVPHLGAVRTAGGNLLTLDSREAMQFVFMFQPKRIVPVGHHTFSHYQEPIEEFREKVALTMYDRRLIVLEEGEVFEKT